MLYFNNILVILINLNGTEPPLMVLITLVLFLIKVKMSAVKKLPKNKIWYLVNIINI